MQKFVYEKTFIYEHGQGEQIVFAYHSDLSGNVVIKFDDFGQIVEIPGKALLAFAAAYVRNQADLCESRP